MNCVFSLPTKNDFALTSNNPGCVLNLINASELETNSKPTPPEE